MRRSLWSRSMPRSIVKPSTAERNPSSACRVKQGPMAVESATLGGG